MKKSFNEAAAMELVLNYVSVEELLAAAMNTFSESENSKDKENADLCFKAIDTFLK